MARINENLTYPQKGTNLFIRRSPGKPSEWQVVSGHFNTVDGKRADFVLGAVLESGIAKGKLARERATALFTEAAQVAAS